jgi:hypothetical protein
MVSFSEPAFYLAVHAALRQTDFLTCAIDKENLQNAR